MSFWQTIGMRRVHVAGGRSHWELDVDERHLNRGGITHGGAIATLADTAIGSAVATVRADDETWHAAVDLTLVFLEPSRAGDTVIAEGEVVRRGGRMAYGECRVRVGDRLVARAHSSYVIFKARST